MNYEEKFNSSETPVFKVVFPNTTNHHNTMFAGKIMETMAEVAFVTATRFARQNFVMVSCDKINFKKPIPADTITKLVGKVLDVGTTSVTIAVTIYVEEMMNPKTIVAVVGRFVLVAVDEIGHSEKIVF